MSTRWATTATLSGGAAMLARGFPDAGTAPADVVEDRPQFMAMNSGWCDDSPCRRSVALSPWIAG